MLVLKLGEICKYCAREECDRPWYLQTFDCSEWLENKPQEKPAPKKKFDLKKVLVDTI